MNSVIIRLLKHFSLRLSVKMSVCIFFFFLFAISSVYLAKCVKSTFWSVALLLHDVFSSVTDLSILRPIHLRNEKARATFVFDCLCLRSFSTVNVSKRVMHFFPIIDSRVILDASFPLLGQFTSHPPHSDPNYPTQTLL